MNEKVEFNRFDSANLGLLVAEHHSPTPNEKQILESVPFMQGQHDFSMLLGERVFDNRLITIQFIKPNQDYTQHRLLLQEIRRTLMLNETGLIYDSYLESCHWVGKCSYVDADNYDSKTKTSFVYVEFDCYPFAIKNDKYYNDEFDVDYFTDGIDQYTAYQIEGWRRIFIYNEGSNALGTTIYATNPMKIIHENGNELSVSKGETTDKFFKMERGKNVLTIIGTGTIRFSIETEVMV